MTIPGSTFTVRDRHGRFTDSTDLPGLMRAAVPPWCSNCEDTEGMLWSLDACHGRAVMGPPRPQGLLVLSCEFCSETLVWSSTPELDLPWHILRDRLWGDEERLRILQSLLRTQPRINVAVELATAEPEQLAALPGLPEWLAAELCPDPYPVNETLSMIARGVPLDWARAARGGSVTDGR